MSRVRMLTVGLAALAGLAFVGMTPTATAQGKKYAAKGTGTIHGKVTLDGTAPTGVKIKIDQSNKDKDHCNKGDTEDLTWVTGAGNGLANVVVFLKPPAGQSFAVDMAKKTWKDQLEIDQPFCAFKPHVSVIFAQYDGKTVQKLVVKNSAPILHNSRVAGSQFKNPAKGETLAAGASKVFDLKADTQVVKINCDAHKWMEAYIWAFDHPYAAVTDKDGKFEIKNAPLGADISVMAWHEVGQTTAKEMKKGIKDGDEINFKITKK